MYLYFTYALNKLCLHKSFPHFAINGTFIMLLTAKGALLKLATWNVRSGGYDRYVPLDEPLHGLPPRLPSISHVTRNLLNHPGMAAVGFLDVFGWADLPGLMSLISLGRTDYRHYSISLDDSRPDMDPRLGITVLASGAVEAINTVRIATRNCVKLMVRNGTGYRAAYMVYLDDLDPTVRLRQIQAILDDARHSPDIPVVIMGDINNSCPGCAPGWLKATAKLAGLGILSRRPILQAVHGLTNVQTPDALLAAGYHHARLGKSQVTARPQIHERLPGVPLGIDQAWTNQTHGFSGTSVDTPMVRQASDHLPVVVTCA